ncbi:hypothetical protein Goklo_012795 [Gossypium klotzschianum]|uniref:Uncharacterized protein n=1 Tax=Gossypium klotzschianum TaxID=34286 RepID=A0A7J8VE27_9ROSI|nr:hypothetical protein [Gossypium klotzschianum]
MLEKVLPHAILKAKLNLESRIRTLKRDWTIVCEYEVCLDEMDVSATQSQPLKPNEDGSTSSNKKKKDG